MSPHLPHQPQDLNLSEYSLKDYIRQTDSESVIHRTRMKGRGRDGSMTGNNRKMTEPDADDIGRGGAGPDRRIAELEAIIRNKNERI